MLAREMKRLSSVVNSQVTQFQFYDSITQMNEIARRYFVMNAFDGSLTMFGVLIGAYFSHVTEPSVILGVGMSTAMAICVSGLWGAFLTESAERQKDLRELECQMQANLENTEIYKAGRFAVIVTAMVDAFAPLVASIFVISPFILARAGILAMDTAYIYSFLMSFLAFFLLGVFLGKISKEGLLFSGARMLLAGFVSAVLTWTINATM